jgi:hypothetical protein
VCLLFERLQVSVRLPEPSVAGVALLHSTGDRPPRRLRTRPAGWRLTAHLLHGRSPGPSETEEICGARPAVYPAWDSPRRDEVGAAATSGLPRCYPAGISVAISTCTRHGAMDMIC